MSQVDDDGSQDKALRKCSTMHGLMTKLLQQIKTHVIMLKKKRALPAEVGNEAEDAQEKLAKDIEGLDKLIVSKGNMNNIKKSLRTAAVTAKAAHKLVETLALTAKGR